MVFYQTDNPSLPYNGFWDALTNTQPSRVSTSPSLLTMYDCHHRALSLFILINRVEAIRLLHSAPACFRMLVHISRQRWNSISPGFQPPIRRGNNDVTIVFQIYAPLCRYPPPLFLNEPDIADAYYDAWLDLIIRRHPRVIKWLMFPVSLMS